MQKPSSSQLFLLFAGFAAALLLVPVLSYVSVFGFTIQANNEKWGQFGDFIGGVLNPLYALLAFLALLYNIRLQAEEMRFTREEFRKSAEAAQQQVAAMREVSSRDELTAIIRSVAAAIDSLLAEVVSPSSSPMSLRLEHVIHEGARLGSERLSTHGPYVQYIENARTSGSIVQAQFAKLAGFAKEYAYFVNDYRLKFGDASPVVSFYRDRFPGVGVLLNDVGASDADTVRFFLIRAA